MGFEIDFLPVGEESQSGAILLRFGNLLGPRHEQTVVLIDGGFQDTADTIIEHLGAHYRARIIDVVVSTHPDSDRTNGLHEIVGRAREGELAIRELWMHRPSQWNGAIERALRQAAGIEYADAAWRTLESAAELEASATAAGIWAREPFSGLSHVWGVLVVVGRTEEFYISLFEEEWRLRHFLVRPSMTLVRPLPLGLGRCCQGRSSLA